MNTPIKRDTDLHLPVATVVTASAGAGKTHALTHKYVQNLLSNVIPRNGLQNVLAITFTNNAAAEMKQRILRLLKLAALGDEKTVKELHEIVSLEPSEIRTSAARLLNNIFDNYSDFQVKTIDSFMATVFKSASLEYGFHPEFQILLSADRIFDLAFDLFSRELKGHSPRALIVENLIRLIGEGKGKEATFLWDPYKNISENVKKVYGAITTQTKRLDTSDLSAESERVKKNLRAQASVLREVVKRSGLTMNSHSEKDLGLASAGDISGLIGRSEKKSPVKKPKGKVETEAYEKWIQEIDSEQEKLNILLRKGMLCYARSFYQPYAEAFNLLQESVWKLKKQYGEIFIDDVNKTLAEHLNKEMVPEVYFRIGETIYHYLIDEFQDTSAIQWMNLFPLVEESLSKGGSLFVVGDTKQSIYGFRDADWTIMKGLTKANPFPSAQHDFENLTMNYRSLEKIVQFNRTVFHEIIPALGFEKETAASGLSDFKQEVREENRGKGYAEVQLLEKDPDKPPERSKILAIIKECMARGYRFSDIALLTPNNSNVVEVSGWLNEEKIPIISHSTLDVRRRKSAGEFIALLRFLDSPVDDLSFATFVLGDAFSAVTARNNSAIERTSIEQLLFHANRRSAGPLYVSFRAKFPSLWERYFEHLFNVVGYSPLYDLLSEAYKIFDVFEKLPKEEASLVKLLEVVQIFEQEGTNTIKDFLEFSGGEWGDDAWKIDVPKNIDALQVMTIHKAKGSEFPVVIVLLYDQPRRGKGYAFDESEDSIRMVKVNKDLGEKVDELNSILADEQFMDTVDSFNKLYVAFTRAENEMYVVGVYAKEPKDPTRFLPATGYEPAKKPKVPPSPMAAENTANPFHHTKRRFVSVQDGGDLGTAEAQRGDIVHRTLEAIEYVSDDLAPILESALRRVQVEMRIDVNIGEMKPVIENFINDPAVQPYFLPKEGRSVLREQELTTGEGILFRADRIVVDQKTVTVIDFKTGGDETEDEYVDQVRNYMKILGEIYPGRKPVGLVAYVDLKKIRRLE